MCFPPTRDYISPSKMVGLADVGKEKCRRSTIPRYTKTTPPILSVDYRKIMKEVKAFAKRDVMSLTILSAVAVSAVM